MRGILFDSHCHMTDSEFNSSRERLMEQFSRSRLRYICTIGDDLESSVKVVKMAEKYDMCYGAVGWHPHNVSRLDEETMFLTLNLYKKPKIKAIGEIGLDYYRNRSPQDIQRHWFARQAEEAVRMKAPIVIHDRDANADVLAILKDVGAFSKERKADFPARPDGSPDARVLLHCYSGSAELADQYVRLGASISIAGPVTYKNARRAVETVLAVDIMHLLIETDAPYLTPEPMRGKRNIPTYVEYTCRKIAEIKEISYEEAAARTTENACRFFGIEE